MGSYLNMDYRTFDYIYIGTGPVLVLDAINRSFKGKTILMVDKASDIGGAWKPINLFGGNTTENAVHYLLPCYECYDFLENTLRIPLDDSCHKYFAFSFLNFPLKIPVGHFLSRLLFNVINELPHNPFGLITGFYRAIKNKKISESKYPKNGSYELIKKIKKLASLTNIEFKFNVEINKIKITNEIVNLTTKNNIYSASKLVISHGFLPPNDLFINGQKVSFKLKKYLRPSLHINTKFTKKNVDNYFMHNYKQVIFPKNSLIKYVHNLNHRSSNSQYIVVAALRHDLKNNSKNLKQVTRILEKYGLIPLHYGRTQNDYFWQDIYLPMLNDEDLKLLNSISKGVIEVMKTEELSKSIGLYQRRWNKIKSFCKINRECF